MEKIAGWVIGAAVALVSVVLFSLVPKVPLIAISAAACAAFAFGCIPKTRRLLPFLSSKLALGGFLAAAFALGLAGLSLSTRQLAQADAAMNDHGSVKGRPSPAELNAAFAKIDKDAQAAAALDLTRQGLAAANSHDFASAAKFYQRAVDLGGGQAAFLLARMHMNGDGFKKDMSAGADLMRKAADMGCPEAEYIVGMMYRNKTPQFGFTHDVGKSNAFLQKAAASGDMEAQYRLGLAYFNGDGVKKSNATAIDLLQKSASQGKAEAKHQIEFMNVTLPGRYEKAIYCAEFFGIVSDGEKGKLAKAIDDAQINNEAEIEVVGEALEKSAAQEEHDRKAASDVLVKDNITWKKYVKACMADAKAAGIDVD